MVVAVYYNEEWLILDNLTNLLVRDKIAGCRRRFVADDVGQIGAALFGHPRPIWGCSMDEGATLR
jgi:hypothetical protein